MHRQDPDARKGEDTYPDGSKGKGKEVRSGPRGGPKRLERNESPSIELVRRRAIHASVRRDVRLS
jgi:hypothetical protein